MAEDEEPSLRGGKINARDKWFGLKTRDGFRDFRRWWHREGKDDEGGKDIMTRDDAERIFDGWRRSNSPSVR